MTHPLTDTMFQAVPVRWWAEQKTPTELVREAREQNHLMLAYRKWARNSYEAGRMVDWRRFTKAAHAARKQAVAALSEARNGGDVQ